MLKNNIIIAFSSNKICNNVISILTKNGIRYTCICKSGASLRKCCSYYENGIIICGSSFIDEPTYNIVEDFYKIFTFIMLSSIDKLNIYDDNKVYKLSTPIKSEDIISTIYIAYYTNLENIKLKDEKTIKKAKNILMQIYNIPENTAHRYIQKKSMDSGKKNIDIANLIIKKLKDR